MIFVNQKDKDEDEDENKEYKVKNKIALRIISIIISIISLIFFLLTEDITLPMVLIDKWTIYMIIILVIQCIIVILSKHKVKEYEKEK